jgi:hypothetical protein
VTVGRPGRPLLLAGLLGAVREIAPPGAVWWSRPSLLGLSAVRDPLAGAWGTVFESSAGALGAVFEAPGCMRPGPDFVVP